MRARVGGTTIKTQGLAKMPFKPGVLARVQLWKAQYRSPAFRYKFLVFRGDSRSGKTTLAKSLFANPFVQTVQSAASLDLREFDWSHNGAIVFDNVNGDSFVLNFRAMIQASNDFHVLGTSVTGTYSYRVWLGRAPIALTADTQAGWNSENPWIKENCYEVAFEEPWYMCLV